MWDLSSPARIELTSPALQGRFLTTGPPGKSLKLGFCYLFQVPIRSSDGASLVPGQAEDKYNTFWLYVSFYIASASIPGMYYF